MKTVAYLRTARRDETSPAVLDRMRAAVERCAQTRGTALLGCYADEGVSGNLPVECRPQGERLLTDAEAGRFDTVLLPSWDRLGRDSAVLNDALDRLHRLDVRVESAEEQEVLRWW